MVDEPEGETAGAGAGAPGDEAAADLADALNEAAGKLRALDVRVQARRWARERSIRLEGSAELLRVLLAALGYPTRDAMSEFVTFDADGLDRATTRSIRRAARAILADLSAASRTPWPQLEGPPVELDG